MGATLVLTGCSKKLNQFQADYFTVNPNPLEVVGEKVPATVTAKIPAKFFVKNAPGYRNSLSGIQRYRDRIGILHIPGRESTRQQSCDQL